MTTPRVTETAVTHGETPASQYGRATRRLQDARDAERLAASLFEAAQAETAAAILAVREAADRFEDHLDAIGAE